MAIFGRFLFSDISKGPVLSKINSQAFENKFPQANITCDWQAAIYSDFTICVFAQVLFTIF